MRGEGWLRRLPAECPGRAAIRGAWRRFPDHSPLTTHRSPLTTHRLPLTTHPKLPLAATRLAAHNGCMEPSQAYLDGRFVPASSVSVSPVDAGFVLGATVAEQLRTFGGQLFRLEAHLARLQQSLRIVQVELDVGLDELAAIAHRLAAGNHRLLPQRPGNAGRREAGRSRRNPHARATLCAPGLDPGHPGQPGYTVRGEGGAKRGPRQGVGPLSG